MYKKIAKRYLFASRISYDLNSSVPEYILEEARKDPYIGNYINKDRSRPIFLGEEPVGFIAPKISGDGVWRLKSTFVLPEYRGKGIARTIIKKFFKNRPGRAFIDKDNVASQRAFKAAGFLPYQKEERWGGGSWWANPQGLAMMNREVL